MTLLLEEQPKRINSAGYFLAIVIIGPACWPLTDGGERGGM